MSIKLRLLLSYIAMILIPIALSILTALIVINFNFGNASNMERFLFDRGTERRIVQEGAATFVDLRQVAVTDPDKLTDTKYLAGLDQKLSIINTGIVVRKGSSIIYTSELYKGLSLSSELPPYGSTLDTKHDPKLIGDRLISIKQQDFSFKDGEKGSIFLLTDVGPIGQPVRQFTWIMFAAIIIILVLTNGIMTYVVSRSIIKPLKSLKKGIEQIKSGNLDFEIKPGSRDEIGQLAVAFEEMRHQLKFSLEQQTQYENNRKELISSISHDLKTPITAVKGYVEGIRDGVADSEEKMDRYIKTIYSKANDMDKLIDELFLFSKLDLKKLPYNFESVYMARYMEDCIEEFQFDMEKKGIKLVHNNNIDKNTRVNADREKLKRVIINIVQNAEKYMDKDEGIIDIDLEEDKDKVTVKIKDNGCGIPEEALPFIFDRFYRADPSRNSSTGGSGLGLAIAKRIIEDHGGSIWAESREGEGTCISFTLAKEC